MTEPAQQALPLLTMTDLAVQAAPISRSLWGEHFAEYLLHKPGAFEQEVARQQALLEMNIQEIGLGAEGLRMLEALELKTKLLRRWTGLQKAKPVADLVRAELEQGTYGKIVIFGSTKAFLHEVKMLLEDLGCVLLYAHAEALDKGDADVTRRVRNKIHHVTRKFRLSRYRVMCSQITGAGTAVDLSHCSEVLVGEADWYPLNNQQAIQRVYKTGQRWPVRVRWAGIEGTFDAAVAKALRNRTRNLVDDFWRSDRKFVV